MKWGQWKQNVTCAQHCIQPTLPQKHKTKNKIRMYCLHYLKKYSVPTNAKMPLFCSHFAILDLTSSLWLPHISVFGARVNCRINFKLFWNVYQNIGNTYWYALWATLTKLGKIWSLHIGWKNKSRTRAEYFVRLPLTSILYKKT